MDSVLAPVAIWLSSTRTRYAKWSSSLCEIERGKSKYVRWQVKISLIMQYRNKQFKNKLKPWYKENIEMEEKVYKTMWGTGAVNIVVGILGIIIGVVSGILLIISGGKLLRNKSKIFF